MFGASEAPAFLAVAPEGYGADVPGWANVGAFGPKRGSMPPIAVLPLGTRQHRQAKTAAYDSGHDVDRRSLGRAGNAQMDVIRHPLQRQDVKVEFDSHLVADVFQAPGDRTAKTFVTIARNPHKNVVDPVDTVRVMIDLDIVRFYHRKEKALSSNP